MEKNRVIEFEPKDGYFTRPKNMLDPLNHSLITAITALLCC